MSPRSRSAVLRLLRSAVVGAVMFGALTLFGAPWQTAADLAAGVVVIEVCNLHHDWWIAGNSRSAVAYRAWLQRRESRRTAAR